MRVTVWPRACRSISAQGSARRPAGAAPSCRAPPPQPRMAESAGRRASSRKAAGRPAARRRSKARSEGIADAELELPRRAGVLGDDPGAPHLDPVALRGGLAVAGEDRAPEQTEDSQAQVDAAAGPRQPGRTALHRHV